VFRILLLTPNKGRLITGSVNAEQGLEDKVEGLEESLQISGITK